MTKRPRGKGTISKTGKTRPKYRGILKIGIDSETGKPKYKRFYGQTIREVDLKISEYQDCGNDSADSLLFSDALNIMIDFEKKTKKVKSNTLDIALVCKRVLDRDLGYFYLSSLNENVVSQQFEKWETNKLSFSYLCKLRNYGRIAFREACKKYHFTLENPFDKLVILNPKKSVKQAYKHFEDDEISEIFLFLPERSKIICSFLLHSGLRIGEALALRYDDIDHFYNTISVNKTVIEHYATGKHVLEVQNTPKTKLSDRTIPLLIAMGRDIQAIEEYTHRLNISSDLLFPSRTGGLISPKNINDDFHAAMIKANIPAKGRSIHSLRHNCVINLFDILSQSESKDLCAIDISKFMGHQVDIAAYIYDTDENRRAERLKKKVFEHDVMLMKQQHTREAAFESSRREISIMILEDFIRNGLVSLDERNDALRYLNARNYGENRFPFTFSTEMPSYYFIESEFREWLKLDAKN